MWAVLKQAMGKNNDTHTLPQTFKIDNKDVRDKSKISDGFNKYFSKIGENTAKNFQKQAHILKTI